MNEIIKLTAPSKEQWHRFHNYVAFQSKDFFVKRLKGIYTFLKQNKLNIVWSGEDKKIESTLRDDTDEVLRKNSGAIKGSLLNFFCGLVGEKENLYKLADLTLTENGLNLAEMVVRQGAISFNTIKKLLKWPDVKERCDWYFGIGPQTEMRWFSSPELAPLALMTDIISWAEEEPQYHYYVTLEPYVIASARLAEYILGHKNNVQLSALENTQGLTEFSGADFQGKWRVLQQLVFTGAIKPGKNKIAASEIKKFANYIQLKEFPGVTAEAQERDTWTLNLVLNLFGSRTSGFKFPKKELSEQDFMRKMFELLKMSTYEIFCLIFKERPKHVTSDFHYINRHEIGLMFRVLQQTLTQADKKLHGKWTNFNSLENVANRLYTECNADFIMIGGIDNIRYASSQSSKAYLPLTQVKAEVHDKIIPGMIKGMALLGGVDMLFNTTGEIVAVRLTDLGRWLLKISDEFPSANQQNSDDKVFEIDDATRMVLVKQPNHPYAKLIGEYAEKVSGERWRITQASLLQGCQHTQDLKSKITRLKNFVIPKPGPELQRILNSLQSRCDKVKIAEAEDPYILYDIDRNDAALHAFIQDTPIIRDNTRKVEGCGLLVRQSFEHKFFSLLRTRGYLTDPESKSKFEPNKPPRK